jgi:phenylalanyl-tRNA synthetase beta chain
MLHILLKMKSLSAELNILRPSLLETSLEVVARNLNHRNNDLKLFEFGKGYFTTGAGRYHEMEQVCMVISGNIKEQNWKGKSTASDFFYAKGLVSSVLRSLGIETDSIETLPVPKLQDHIIYKANGELVAGAGEVNQKVLSQFGIKQPVFFAALNWDAVLKLTLKQTLAIKELPRFPSVMRDISMVVPKHLAYAEVENSVNKLKLAKLQEVKLFDIFESEKLGTDKKSIAVSFTFLDEEKTLTDKEIDGWMNKIMVVLESDLKAEIRK